MQRRSFLKETTIASLGFLALSKCNQNLNSAPQAAKRLELIADPESYLDLPAGFNYNIISRQGTQMSDGFFVPGRPDGMGAFALDDNRVIIVRNHENSPTPIENSPFGQNNELLAQIGAEKVYDLGSGNIPGLGGTTTIIYNETEGVVEKEFLSLAGTYRNCAGGITPWNSWLTCEEDTTPKGEDVEKNHGYVFEVKAQEQAAIMDPQPIKAMGRFNHEAVAVDPKTGIVYQTEDQGDGLIYRYVPLEKGNLLAGGRLQVLAIKDQKSLDTRNWKEQIIQPNDPLAVEWLDIDQTESEADDLRHRGFALGAARFARGEGMWMGDGEVFFACTNGGPKLFGQVFRYQLSTHEGQENENEHPGLLELYVESEDKAVLHMCDNLTISPEGNIFLCEDNGEENRIHFINPDGQISLFAINRSSSSEFAGAVFSPSGKTLFVNIQENGDTIVITGPWDKLT